LAPLLVGSDLKAWNSPFFIKKSLHKSADFSLII